MRGMFKIYDIAMKRNRQIREACLRYMVNGSRQKRGGVFRIYDEPLSPKEGACSRYMVNGYRQIRGVFKIYMLNRKRQKRGPCSRYLVNRKRQKRGRV